MVECISCGAEVPVNSSTIAGEILECPDCGIELEVKSLNPIVVAEAPTEKEDWGQ